MLEKEHQNNSYQNMNRDDNLLVLNFLFSAHFQQEKLTNNKQYKQIKQTQHKYLHDNNTNKNNNINLETIT